MDHFETMHTCCGHIEDVPVVFLMELELILTQLLPFKPSHFLAAFLLCRVLSLYSQLLLQFQWMFLKHCRHIVDILECGFLMELRFIMTELLPFKFSHFWQLFCTVEYGVCVISSTNSFQWMYYGHIGDVYMGF